LPPSEKNKKSLSPGAENPAENASDKEQANEHDYPVPYRFYGRAFKKLKAAQKVKDGSHFTQAPNTRDQKPRRSCGLSGAS
jgi:hypothetical protein